jgi:hypothetical protein
MAGGRMVDICRKAFTSYWRSLPVLLAVAALIEGLSHSKGIGGPTTSPSS